MRCYQGEAEWQWGRGGVSSSPSQTTCSCFYPASIVPGQGASCVALVALLVFAINSNYKRQTKTQKWATSVSPGIGQTFNYLDEDAKVACFFTQFRLQFWFSVLGRDQRGVLSSCRCPEKVNSITQFLSLFMLLSLLPVVVCAVRFGNYKQLYKLQLIKLQAPCASEKTFSRKSTI